MNLELLELRCLAGRLFLIILLNFQNVVPTAWEASFICGWNRSLAHFDFVGFSTKALSSIEGGWGNVQASTRVIYFSVLAIHGCSQDRFGLSRIVAMHGFREIGSRGFSKSKGIFKRSKI